MIRKDKKTYKDGSIKTQIRVVEGYRPGPGLPPKQRTIQNFGYLEDQADPVSFMESVQALDKNRRAEASLRVELPATAQMYSKENRSLNYGYKFLEALYDRLEIRSFIDGYVRTHKLRCAYSLADIFEFLVLLRILTPLSKRATCQMKHGFYDMETDFTLQDIYRSLDHVADFDMALQQHLNQRIQALIGRDLSYAFYDVTNYFFEIDFPDPDGGLRKRGVSKEHRVDPIVQMGLFMDSKGLPVSMSLFPGNTSDCLTLQPAMETIRASYGLGRIIVVADKGMNSSKNMDRICQNGDGYVVSQILRGKKGQRYHEKLFDASAYTWNGDGSYKYQLFTEDYTGMAADGKKEQRQRKVLIYWNRAEAEMARHKREEKLEKARKATKNKVYGIKKGVEEYMTEKIVDPITGEVLEHTRRVLTIDEEKAERDARFDGYFCIITSELAYDERQIRRAYGGLWRIEQSFRVMKSGLEARPVYLSTDSHIRAHFLICFTALLILRMMQHEMGPNALPAERIAQVLSTASCQVLRGGIIHLQDVGGCIAFETCRDKNGKEVERLAYSDQDRIANDYRKIQKTFKTDFWYIYPRQEIFNRFLKSIR